MNRRGKRSWRIGFCLAALVVVHGVLPSRARALDRLTPLTSYPRRSYTRAAGLPSGTVKALHQSHDGYLWVATSEGLARFDGVQFQVSGFELSPQPGQEDIRALAQMPDGRLVIGLEKGGGIALLTPEGPRRLLPPVAETGARYVRALKTAADGQMWVGTASGVYRFDGDRLTGVAGLERDNVRALATTPDGLLWVGTSRGALLLDRQGRRPAERPDHSVQALHLDADGSLWVGSSNVGLWVRSPDGAWRSYGAAEGLTSTDIRQVLRDRDGTLWVGSDDAGLFRLGDRGFQRFSAADGLSGDRVRALLQDREGNLWVGAIGGLDRFAPALLLRMGAREGIAASPTAIAAAGGGGIWLATSDRRVHRMSSERDRLSTITSGAHPLRSLAEDGDGVLWGVWTTERVTRLRGGAFVASGLDDVVWRVSPTIEGDILLTTPRVRRLRGDVSEPLGFEHRGLSFISARRPGRTWLASPEAIHLWQGGKLQRFEVPGVGLEAVHDLVDDGEAVWFATWGGGLKVLLDGRLMSLGQRQGLPSARICFVTRDASRMWLATSTGVGWMDRDELLAVARGSSPRAGFSMYAADEFGGLEIGRPCGVRDGGGRLWLMVRDGVAIVDPSRLPTVIPVRALIEALSLDGRSYRLDRPVKAPPGRGDLVVRYTAPTFRSPETASFRYRLVGRGGWIEAGVAREARFLDLPPGDHRFEVQARGEGGVWGPAVAVPLHLEAPFHRTPTFYGLVAAILAAGLGVAYRWRLGLERRRHAAVLRERERISRELHDTLAQGFVAASFELECIRRALVSEPARVDDHLKKARAVVKGSLDEARRSVWGERAEVLERGDLTAALQELATTLSPDGRILVKLEGAARRLPPDLEHGFYRMAQEAIANALRHAQAQRIEVTLTFHPRRVRLVVQDDGAGFDPGGARRDEHEHGLDFMRGRAKDLRATVAVKSVPGRGTTVTMEAKVR